MSSRYFKNPYVDNWKHGSEKVSTEWLTSEASEFFERIFHVTRSDYDDFDAYTGISGMCYALLKACEILPQRKRLCYDFYLKKLEPYLSDAVGKKLHGSTARTQSRYLLGTLGSFVIGVLCEQANGTLNEHYLKRIKDIREIVLHDNYQGHGDDEMLVGRSGYVAAIMILRAEMGEALDATFVKPVLEKMIESGRSYSRQNHSPTPLMYQYHGKEYLGAAHGLMGIIQMLLSFYEMLDESARRDVVTTLEWIITLQFPNGNFPTNAAHATHYRGDDELVQWCHGATGAVFMLITAYIKLQKDKYLETARKALEVIWEKGVLYKGPGICHGVAGNGYAFLLFYRLTREEKYLECARCFARIFCDKTFRDNARTPDSPISLYEGIGGSLCYLCDLVQIETAQFPLIPIPF